MYSLPLFLDFLHFFLYNDLYLKLLTYTRKGVRTIMLKSYIAFDLETTGLDPMNNEIIEIGALKVRDGKVSARNPKMAKKRHGLRAFSLHSITAAFTNISMLCKKSVKLKSYPVIYFHRI